VWIFLGFLYERKGGILMSKNRPAGDEEVEGLWRDFGRQYKMYKWSDVKTFKFDLAGYQFYFFFLVKILLNTVKSSQIENLFCRDHC